MPTEDKLLERLDRAVRASRVADTIERTTLELGALLTKDPRAALRGGRFLLMCVGTCQTKSRGAGSLCCELTPPGVPNGIPIAFSA